jgi:sugar lactone lactonase YvrE
MPPRVTLLGPEGSTPALTMVYEEDARREPTGLAFNRARPYELWIVNRSDDSLMIVTDVGQANMLSVRRRDAAATHFMNVPTGIAFGENGNWASCGENDGTQGTTNTGGGFTGPALFTSELAIFARSNATGLGTHLDMLHDSPYCMGIAHDTGNAYWVFEGFRGALVRYDFVLDHGPGEDDHSDGRIVRWVEGAVRREPGVPSHLAFDASDGSLYAADTGNQRIVKLDTRSGTPGERLISNEPLAEHRRQDNATLVEVVKPGAIERPSGLALHDGILYVTDPPTSRLLAFDASGRLLRTVETGLPPSSLAGITVGPDNKVYYLDLLTSRVYRVDP